MQIERPDWFTPPETVYWDEVTGYAINLPFVLQGPPFWWKTDPQAATRLERLRAEMADYDRRLSGW